MPLSNKQKTKIEDLYSKGCSYSTIADRVECTVKQVDNYVYYNGITNKVGKLVTKRTPLPTNVPRGNRLAPVNRLKKAEIVWLSVNCCKAHGVPYLAHWECFLAENPDQERLGFFDIEASNLKATFGILLSYCILDDKTGEIYFDAVTKEDMNGDLDYRIVCNCVDDMQRVDKVVTFYGTRFDLPFIRTRAAYYNIPFPEYGQLLHKDVYYVVRNKFCLHSNRLEQACQSLVGKTEKTPITPEHWIRALQGYTESINYILEHNKGDVRDLQRLYHKVINTTLRRDTSI